MQVKPKASMRQAPSRSPTNAASLVECWSDASPVECSTAELAPTHGLAIVSEECGAPGGTRTHDLQVRNLTLYPLSYERARDGGGEGGIRTLGAL